MTSLVLFVEEESCRIVVESLLQRIAPTHHCIVVQHEGKSDLLRSYPRKILAWRYPEEVPFIVLRDTDGADCSLLKQELVAAIPTSRRSRTKIRLIVHCLEGWYLGDPAAIEAAGLITMTKREDMLRAAKFRNPDRLTNAKQEFLRLHQETGQLALAQLLAPKLALDGNKSASFNLFVRTVREWLNE